MIGIRAMGDNNDDTEAPWVFKFEIVMPDDFNCEALYPPNKISKPVKFANSKDEISAPWFFKFKTVTFPVFNSNALYPPNKISKPVNPNDNNCDTVALFSFKIFILIKVCLNSLAV